MRSNPRIEMARAAPGGAGAIRALLAAGLSMLLAAGCGSTPAPEEEEPKPLSPVEIPLALARGEKTYRKACFDCHGARGDGNGPRARRLEPRPWDFTRGVYKCRSTATGVLPLDADLFMTITIGLPGTAMKGYGDLLSADARRDLVEYLKTFSPRFREERIEPEEVLKIPAEPTASEKSIARGAELYRREKCIDCHGEGGRGDGPESRNLRDGWGRPTRPFDLTIADFRCGSSDQDIYRTLFTGLDGTPMPSFADTVDPPDRWPLVHFVRTLRRKPTLLEKVLLEVPE
jgi:mono/diheme cytochrome c family protein